MHIWIYRFLFLATVWISLLEKSRQSPKIQISPLKKSKWLAPVWISPTEKSRLVSKTWVSPSDKSIYACRHAHSWIHRTCAYMCAYMDFSDGEIRIFRPVWISPLKKSKQSPTIRISPSEKSIYECIYAHILIPCA